jgi:hypothetical protein
MNKKYLIGKKNKKRGKKNRYGKNKNGGRKYSTVVLWYPWGWVPDPLSSPHGYQSL